TEKHYENAILELFNEELGYMRITGVEVERDYSQPLYMELLRSSLIDINMGIDYRAIEEAINKVCSINSGTLISRNQLFTEYLQNGVEVNYFNGNENVSTLVKLIDYESPLHNNFTIANQWTIEENSVKRPDIIIFINGLPLVVMELKSPSREDADTSEAYCQLRNYMQEIPSLFIYNAMCVMSDMSVSKVGTITAGEDRYMEWKTSDGKSEDMSYAAFEVFFRGIFDRTRLIEIIRNYICFSDDAKIMAAYHQFYAVRKAVVSTTEAIQTDGKGGVFWHTQGSGKSLSMVFYAKLLQQAVTAPTLVVITDRKDLDGQLFKQFARCKNFLRQTPIQATSRVNLKELLDNREANGIFFTTMQKFEECNEPLSIRRNIIVIADEAHRSQYGLTEKVSKDGKVKIGAARLVRNSFPNATFLGFTGTPISQKDRSTREVFGDYIDVYDMTQAVVDGATKPVFYESRVIKLDLDEDTLQRIDNEYDAMAEEAEEYIIEKSKKELGCIDSIFGAPQTINSLCEDIIKHYEDSRQYEQTGKAMIVAYSRPIAISIYNKLMEMRPLWSEKVAVVMTSGNGDPEEWKKVIGNDNYKKELEIKFKDDDSSLKIAIVVNMWLTGFDVPSLSTMYVYKPMSGHNLMQAIARVNRVFGNKVGGLVVDYVGIASALKKAMNDYTIRDRKNYGDTDITKTAYPEFSKKLEVCQDIMHGYDYSQFFGDKDYLRANAIKGGIDYLKDTKREDKQKLFIKEALILSQLQTLCKSILSYDERIRFAYFEAVRSVLVKVEGKGQLSFKEVNNRINELIKQSIKSEGVINLFSDIKEEFSIFDPKFLEDISQMKEKNFAVELLRKLIAEQVRIYQKTNAVRAEKFSVILSRAMSNYLKGLLTNEEVIEELLKTAKDIISGESSAKELNLTNEELAFYDALTKPDAVKDFYDNDQLISITKELTEALRNNKTIDWNAKESARAGMRRIIKRLLKKYKYPPEGQEDALETIMKQCNMWSENN
ncbi:MAG: type I restriction endonuclease subunit R, partial [Bacteroidales bacterium]